MSKENKSLEQFFKSFAEAEGMMEFKIASETSGEKIPVISTGSPTLDDALNCNGLGKGFIHQFYGKPGSAKTASSLLLIKEAQKENKTSKQLYIDAEGTFDESWATLLGCDTSRIVLIQDELAVSGKRLFEMLCGVPKEDKTHFYAGKSKVGLLDEIAAGNLDFNVIILDSLGALQVPQEQVSEIGKINISPVPRFLSTALKKLSLDVKRANVVFIMINHVRNTMNMYGPDHASAGGNSYHHFLSTNIFYELPQRKDASILDDKERKIGSAIKFTIEKNKKGVWPRSGTFKIDFTRGIVDTHEEIGNLAMEYDIIKRPSTMSYEYGDQKWVGAQKFFDTLKDNKALCDELLEKITAAREAKKTKNVQPVVIVDKEISIPVVEKSKKSDKS